MDEKENLRRRQREFLFVFSSSCSGSVGADTADRSSVSFRESVPDEERAALLRRRLISELRELGC